MWSIYESILNFKIFELKFINFTRRNWFSNNAVFQMSSDMILYVRGNIWRFSFITNHLCRTRAIYRRFSAMDATFTRVSSLTRIILQR